MNTDSRQYRFKGFTLIELLVVIAIIALIAAILFPVFASAREKARQATCTSNEKQIGLSILQYVQDNDELAPCGLATTSSGRGWLTQIQPYIHNYKIMICPDDTFNGFTPAPASWQVFLQVSYAINSNVFGKPITTGAIGATYPNIATQSNPASTVMLFECTNGFENISAGQTGTNAPTGTGYITSGYNRLDGTAANSTQYGGFAAYATGAMGGHIAAYTTGAPHAQAAPYHNGGANYLACDGHVKWLLPQLVSPGQSNSNTNCPQDTAGTACTAAPSGSGTVAAGVSNMQMSSGGGTLFTLTFSPI